MLTVIFLVATAMFVLAYIYYGRFLEKKFDVDYKKPTPAHTDYDGVDRVPAKCPVLLGHHFSSIAGAGPIVGPIIAALSFGWLPALLWIVIGSIFVGGVHDFGSLMASIRHKAMSIGEVAKQNMSPLSYKMLLVFIWLALVYILIVFIDLTSLTFVKNPEVTTSSSLFIVFAVLFGISIYKLKMPLLPASLIFVPLVFGGIYLGHLWPVNSSVLPAIHGEVARTYNLILIVYALIASIAPVWILLQPRDFLSSFLLYASILGAFIGILFGGFQINYPAFTDWSSPTAGTLFPILFITIACGACSGFHTIVASGTTSKQLNREADARPIGYGAMLIEGLIAVIALFTVAMLNFDDATANQHPLNVYGAGLGKFLSILGLPPKIGASFGILAVSTFLLTTLDTATRLARYIFEELFNLKGRLGQLIGTPATLLAPLLFTFITLHDAQGNVIPAWKAIWPVFGATNQLLAGLALLVIFVWLRKKGKKTFFIVVPMLFMMSMTLWALVQLVLEFGFTSIGIIGMLLLVLAVLVTIEAGRVVLVKNAKI